jgi:FAD/FMN-containing dehydrogenase
MTVHAPPPDTLLAVLQARLGAAHVLTAETDLAGHIVEARGLYRGTTTAVVRPGSTEEVAFVVQECARAGVPIVPQGGNTGLVGGGVPHGGVVLSLARLDRVREVDR